MDIGPIFILEMDSRETCICPFDGIIVTCGAPYVPEELKYQLTVGGRMVIPVVSKMCNK